MTTTAMFEAVNEVQELAERDLARTQTDFMGRMAQCLCEWEGVVDETPDDEWTLDQLDRAADALSGLAGLALAQLVMVRRKRAQV